MHRDDGARRRAPSHDVRVAVASLAASERWAGTTAAERRKATEPGRQASEDRFRRQAAEKWPDLDGEDLERAARLLKAAHYRRLQLRSAKARQARKRGDGGA